MMDNLKIDRINALAHKAKSVGLTEEEMRRFNFKQGDSEGFVNYPLSIRGINLSAMFIETHRDIRVSLRSRGDVDVNVFARRYFGGGGHVRAAGCTMSGRIHDVVNNLSLHIAKQLDAAGPQEE